MGNSNFFAVFAILLSSNKNRCMWIFNLNIKKKMSYNVPKSVGLTMASCADLTHLDYYYISNRHYFSV